MSEAPQHMCVYLEFLELKKLKDKSTIIWQPTIWKFDLVNTKNDESIVRMNFNDRHDLESRLWQLRKWLDNYKNSKNKVKWWQKKGAEGFYCLKHFLKNNKRGIIYTLSAKSQKDFQHNIEKMISELEKIETKFKNSVVSITVNYKNKLKAKKEVGSKEIKSIIDTLESFQKPALFTFNLRKLVEINTNSSDLQLKITKLLKELYITNVLDPNKLKNKLNQINKWELEYYFDKLNDKFFKDGKVKTKLGFGIENKLQLLFDELEKKVNHQNTKNSTHPKVTGKNKEVKNLKTCSSLSTHINMSKAKKLFAWVLEQKINPPTYEELLKNDIFNENFRQPKPSRKRKKKKTKENCASLALKSLKIIGHKIPRKNYTFLGYITPSKLLPIKNIWHGIKRKSDNFLKKIIHWFTEVVTKINSTNYKLPNKDRDNYNFILKYATKRLRKYVSSRSYFFGLFSSVSRSRSKKMRLLRQAINKITRNKSISHIEKYKLLFKKINENIKSIKETNSRLRNALQDIKCKMLRKCDDTIFEDLCNNEKDLLFEKIKNSKTQLQSTNLSADNWKKYMPNSYDSICKHLLKNKYWLTNNKKTNHNGFPKKETIKIKDPNKTNPQNNQPQKTMKDVRDIPKNGVKLT
ncbi:MAG: hypothetical protein PVI75_02810 [Gammaproteobacteria bacterium]